MSEITIVNEALALIGVPSIASFSENINPAKVANIMYPTSRDTILRMHTCGFATRRATSSSSTAAIFGTEQRHTLPANCIRVVELYGTTLPWKIENGEILVDDININIKYIYKETDTTKFDSLFTQCLVYYLASKMAHPLGASDMAGKYYELFLSLLSKAASVDANEDAPIELISRALIVLGAPSIVNRDDSRLYMAEKIYETARDGLLKAHPWNFALSRGSTGGAAVTPPFEYSNSWSLTSGMSPACLKVLEVYDSSGVWSTTSWRVESGNLLCNISEPKIKYIAKIT